MRAGDKVNNIKKLRKRNGLLQQDMAEILNISRATYNSKETGKQDFNKTEIDKIIMLFGLPYEEIFFDKVAHIS
jgi:putative transcriptional regulator